MKMRSLLILWLCFAFVGCSTVKSDEIKTTADAVSSTQPDDASVQEEVSEVSASAAEEAAAEQPLTEAEKLELHKADEEAMQAMTPDIVKQHNDEMQTCWKKVRYDSNATLTYSWLVHPDGSVSDARVVDSNVKLEVLRYCMQNTIELWTYPARDVSDAARVKHTFNFSKKKKK